MRFHNGVPPSGDLQELMAAKHVTRVLVADAQVAEWTAALSFLGPGQDVGGVRVFPACGSPAA